MRRRRRDPLHPRDRQIDCEIAQSVRLAHSRRPLSALTLKVIARIYPPPLRTAIVSEHLKLAKGLVELLELQAADRQAN